MTIIVISGEKGAGYSRQSCRSCLQWLQWLHNLHISWTENFSLTVMFWGYIRTYSTRHERKPRLERKLHLQDGTVVVDTDKYRLVGIPPSGHEPPDVNWQGFVKHLERNHDDQRVVKCDCIELRMCNRNKSETWPFVSCSKWCRVRTSPNRSYPKLPLLPVCRQTGWKGLLRQKRCRSVHELAQ